MTQSLPTLGEALARALAMFIAADGRVDARELNVLDKLDAFRRLGVSRERFVGIARLCAADVGVYLRDRSWLCTDHLTYIDALLDAIADTEDRMFVCQLAAAAIAADGKVTHDEQLVYDHALAYWHIEPSNVTPAILDGRAR